MKRVKSMLMVYIIIFFAAIFSVSAMALVCQDQDYPPDYCAKVYGAILLLPLIGYFCF